MNLLRVWSPILWTLWPALAACGAEPNSLQKQLSDLEVQGAWIYNDLAAGFAEARRTGKPSWWSFGACPEAKEGSSAEKDGFKAGDDIVSLSGQALISVADIQWVLQQADDAGALKAEVLRQGKKIPLTLTLAQGWRTKNDVSWRKHVK